VKYGFYEMLNEYELYLTLGGKNENDLVLRLFKRIVLLMYPIIPSISEYLSSLLKEELIIRDEMFKVYDFDSINKMEYIKRTIKLIQQKMKRKKCAGVLVKISLEYKDWQKEVLSKKLEKDAVCEIIAKFGVDRSEGMKFCANNTQEIVRVDEIDAWNKLKWYAEKLIGVDIEVVTCDSTHPMNPIIELKSD
jgi:leucyl-tRNA synthetase